MRVVPTCEALLSGVLDKNGHPGPLLDWLTEFQPRKLPGYRLLLKRKLRPASYPTFRTPHFTWWNADKYNKEFIESSNRHRAEGNVMCGGFLPGPWFERLKGVVHLWVENSTLCSNRECDQCRDYPTEFEAFEDAAEAFADWKGIK